MRPRARWLAAVAAVALVGGGSNPASNADAASRAQDQPETAAQSPMRNRITTTDQSFIAVLEDSETARDFASLLPIELMLNDYNQTEKVADLPRRLSTAGAPDGADPAVGDLAYFAPWGNLAIYYRDFAYSRGLVRLGRLEGGAERLAEMRTAKARIEIILED